eukprot:scaffold184803_cov15-Tisochrysis_lutea.AAC.1
MKERCSMIPTSDSTCRSSPRIYGNFLAMLQILSAVQDEMHESSSHRATRKPGGSLTGEVVQGAIVGAPVKENFQMGI